jgi:hypothetical protein
MPKTTRSRSGGRQTQRPVKLSRKRLAEVERDPEGPLAWIHPVMESAYMQLRPRAAEPAVAAAAAAVPLASTTGDSVLEPGTRTAYAPVSVTSWRELMAEYKQRKAGSPLPVALDAVPSAPMIPGGRNWLPLGPAVVLHGQTEGNQPVGGRVAALAIAPGGQVVYAASANGGVFRSDDGATSWKALMDGFDLDPTNYASDSLACGAIALDPAAPQRVYVGTGEGDSNVMFSRRITGALPAYRGVGPIRTDDSGATWQPEASSPDLAGEAFFALAVDPANRENVVGATTAGLYQRVATAGGFQWVRQREEMHSAVVVTSLGGATRFFAAQWGGLVYSSVDGQSWSPAGTGFPTGNVGRIALGAQANNPNLVYALVADANGNLRGLYRLDNLAGGWQTVSDLPPVLASPQGGYDLAIAVDPVDPSCVYLGGDRLSSSPGPASIWRCVVQAAGNGFTAQGAVSIGAAAHADVHSLLHTPGDPNELWCTCDGGVFLSRDPKGSGKFASQNNGLACLCSNFFAQHPTDPNVLFVGLQDNGTARTDSGALWTHVNSGDGGYCLIHWANPDQVLVYANGNVYRSTTGGKDEGSWAPVWQFTWATMTEPIVGTPYNPAQPADADLVAVGAGRFVLVSTDFAATWQPGMTMVLPGDAGNVFALKFASPARLFIGTTNGQVFRADLAGNKWTLSRLDNVAAAPLGLSGLISDIDVDWADATLASIYVTFGGRGDRRRVWRFDGARWEARSGAVGGNNLLDIEHNAIVVDRAAPNNLYVAADLGVWQSTDAGQSWSVMRDGLPEAAVFDLQIHPTQRLLRAATYGRGLYEIQLG